MLSGGELRQVLDDLTIVIGGWFGGAHTTPTDLGRYVEPFLLGAMTLGFLCGIVGYVLMRVYWRWHVVKAWRRRLERRQAQAAG
jgi:uncharacterized protein (DUF2062 family)